MKRRFLVGGLFLCLTVPPAMAQSSLKSRRDFAVGEHPVAVLTVDFDGDGFLDLISASQTTGAVSLMKGFGDGTLRLLKSVVVGGQPSGIAFADMNGDGRADIVSANQLTRDVTVNLGDGLGGFGAKISSPVMTVPDPVTGLRLSAAPAGLVVGDWNGDLKPDVATVNTRDNNVAVLLGDGTGHFGPAVLKSVGTSPVQIATADFSFPRDTFADLLVVNNLSNSFQVGRGDGRGGFTFGSQVSTGAGSTPLGLVVADFNADGKSDFAISNTGLDTVAVYLGAGDLTFGTPRSLSASFGPQALVAADLNKDGKLDLAVTLSRVSGEGQVAVMTGDGLGAFAPSPVAFTGPEPDVMTAGDFNRDGNVDLVTASLTGNTVSVLQNTGAAPSVSFLMGGKVTLPVGSFPQALVVADFNRDGKPDLAVANEFLNNVSVATGADCLGGFGAVNSANNTGITPFSIVATTFSSGDTCIDLVTANNGDDTLSYLQGNCAGNFTVTNGLPVGCVGTVSVAAGEISGDLNNDIAFVCENDGMMCTHKGTGASGASSFGPPVCTPVGVGGSPEAIVLQNFNLDALNDAAIAVRDYNHVAIAISDGLGGVVDIPATFPTGAQPEGIAWGLIDSDNYRDLVTANSGSTSVSGLLGDGGGVFSFPSIDSQAGLAPTAVAVADFNLDGKNDVAVVNTNANNVSLLLGDGTGQFYNVGNFGTRDLPTDIAVGNFNCDNKPDLAITDNFNDTVTILLNQSVVGDPLQATSVSGSSQTVFQWGMVPGALYDLIRGQVKSVTQTATTFNLGAVTCQANDTSVTDTANTPDAGVPPVGDAYFYAVRSVVEGVPGNYTVSLPSGKPGVPASGGCP
ncbi:MAG TPA: VCBS repeat-containing protein [Candidatus Polarisedimenticolia bacterium]|nr:VCBS repeat-containing protein [Candidatus Polarisedimenticolia bacterium]